MYYTGYPVLCGMAILDFWNSREAWEGCQDDKGEKNVCECGGQRTASQSWFSSFTTWLLIMEIGLLGLGTEGQVSLTANISHCPNFFTENLSCADLFKIPETGL